MNDAPLFQLFDALPAHIEDALTASIKRFGVLVPVTVDQHGVMLDGHHRARIADRLGVKYDRLVRPCADDDERREIARTLNSDRRQLTEEQRRAVVVELRQQGHSERAIAGALGVSQPTVHRDIERAGDSGESPVEPTRAKGLDGKSYPARRPQVLARDQREPQCALTALPEDDYTSPLPDGPRYCKYCYEERDLEMGEDGSLIVCSHCKSGLAPWDEAVAAGGYDAFVALIERRFYEEHARRPQVLARDDREQQRAQTALQAAGDNAPAKTLDLKRVERIAREKQAEERRAELAEQAPQEITLGNVDLRYGDFRTVLDDIPDATVDAVITDPPYPGEFRPLFADLGELAARVLQPNGVLAVMCGQYYLPDYITLLAEHMQYRWCGAYIAQGPRTRVHAAKVGTGWKPILIFQRPDADPPFILDDLFDSAGDDKSHHHWGQSESGMAAIVERLTQPGHLIIDPFLGGGTTGVVCQALGRKFIGCDVDPLAVDAARARFD